MANNKIAEARKAKGWTQAELAERMGTAQQTIQRYEAGTRDIRASVLKELSEVLDVTVAYLLGMTGNVQPGTSVEVPLYGSIAAGTPLEMMEAESLFPIPAEMHEKYPNAFLLRVEGESMNRILPHGSYALVDPCSEVERDGQPYAIRVGDLSATIKRVRKLENGYELLPDSTDPSFLPQALVRDHPGFDTFTVVGRVVWHCIPFDWAY